MLRTHPAAFQPLGRTGAEQQRELLASCSVERFQPTPLVEPSLDHLGVVAFQVRQDDELIDISMVAHVPRSSRVAFPPFGRRTTEERDVQNVGLVGVHHL